MQIENKDVLEHIKTLPNCSVNTTFADPPYFLGTEWHYVDGKLQMKGSGKDFMGKWSIANADWWRAYFAELYRVMKFGGYVAFFSIDRQAWAFQTLMVEAGFEICQTLHWLKISNFPKSSDASKKIDKRLRAERKVVGENKFAKINGKKNNLCYGKASRPNESISQSDLGQTFEGYKYGIAPLKAITEPLLVFRKAPKNGSVLENLMNLHNSEISPAVLDIEGNRVGTSGGTTKQDSKNYKDNPNYQSKNAYGSGLHVGTIQSIDDGRFPCTMFLNSESAELLDSQLDVISFELNGKIHQEKRKEFELMIWQHTQNGTLQEVKVLHVEREMIQGDKREKKKAGAKNGKDTIYQSGHEAINTSNYNDSGYLSKVMHSCDFTQDDYDSYVNGLCAFTNDLADDRFYYKIVNPTERNAGCESFEKQNANNASVGGSLKGITNTKEPKNNNHPTLKPIALTRQMSSLFRLPKGIEQTVYVPFCGTGSEIIGLIKAGYNPDKIIGCEINSDYIQIAKARIEYYSKIQSIVPLRQNTFESTKVQDTQNKLF